MGAFATIFNWIEGVIQLPWVDYGYGVVHYFRQEPWTFLTSYFWIFFIIVMLGYSLVYQHNTMRTVWLTAVSFFFYWKMGGLFIILLLFSTLSDYTIGRAIHLSQNKRKRLTLLVVSIVVNLWLLSYFKYGAMYIEMFNNLTGAGLEVHDYFTEFLDSFYNAHGFQVGAMILPVGISFYTFQTISYSVDIYRREVEPVKNIVDFGFYVSFFPQLVMGPIVRAKDFIPQIYQPYSLSRYEFGIAAFWILQGLAKKVILADFIADGFQDKVFMDPQLYTGFQNLMAMYAYSLEVYADFSGYTDMAIGIALLMGFRLPKNFNSPYKAASTGEFWKRWHISLSQWLKDYLYIPLGGSRGRSFLTYAFFPLLMLTAYLLLPKGEGYWAWIIGVVSFGAFLVYRQFYPNLAVSVTTNINLVITMFLGGLWHGGTFLFLIWGGLNGIGIVVYKVGKNIADWTRKDDVGYRIGQIFLGSLFTALVLWVLYLSGMNGESILTFGLWALLSLLGLAVYLLVRGKFTETKTWYWISRFWMIFLTFNFITYTRIWFRNSTMEKADLMWSRITDDFSLDTAWQAVLGDWPIFLTLVLGFIIHWLPSSFKTSYREGFARLPLYWLVAIAVVIIFIIFQFKIAAPRPFIYLQF